MMTGSRDGRPASAIGSGVQFERNHYDRLVHFSFGLLLFWPLHEFWFAIRGLARLGPVHVAVEFVLAVSGLYEIFEQMLTLLMAPAAMRMLIMASKATWDA
ncbi:MAG: DUF2238 domain-containing protein [Sphingomonadaceae bacterium]